VVDHVAGARTRRSSSGWAGVRSLEGTLRLRLALDSMAIARASRAFRFRVIDMAACVRAVGRPSSWHDLWKRRDDENSNPAAQKCAHEGPSDRYEPYSIRKMVSRPPSQNAECQPAFRPCRPRKGSKQRSMSRCCCRPRALADETVIDGDQPISDLSTWSGLARFRPKRRYSNCEWGLTCRRLLMPNR